MPRLSLHLRLAAASAPGATARLLRQLVFCVPLGAMAGPITGKVVSIADGDTLTVLVGKAQARIRLSEIDAPERGQAFGQRARQALGDLCFQKEATVMPSGIDRYDRTIGRVWCDGVDANAALVEQGMAWVYERYAKDRLLFGLERQARAARRGLWADAAPVPPWVWRKRQSD